MPTNFPGALDSLTNPTSLSNQSVLSHSDQHANANDAIEAMQVSIGITGSADTESLRYMQERFTAKGDSLVYNGTEIVRAPVGPNGYMEVSDNTTATGRNWIPPTSGGTVTSSAFTNGNGVNGVVSNPTTTPTFALSFPNSGIQKSNGTALSTATAGTDYLTPATALPAGCTIDFAGSSIPSGWLLCDGSAVSRTTYSSLFTAISTTWGAGDGSTTFNLPPSGKVRVGKSTAGTFNTLGSTGGEETHTLTIAEMPEHGHDLLTGDAGGGVQSKIQKQAGVYNPTWETQIGAYDIVGLKGNGDAHNNLQPYAVFNTIIKY